MKKIAIMVLMLGGFSNGAFAGSVMESLLSAVPGDEIEAVAVSVPVSMPVKAVVPTSVLPVGYNINIKDADKKFFAKMYASHAVEFKNVGRNLVGNKIENAEFFVDFANNQGNMMVYTVSITNNRRVVGQFRVDANTATGQVDYSLIGG